MVTSWMILGFEALFVVMHDWGNRVAEWVWNSLCRCTLSRILLPGSAGETTKLNSRFDGVNGLLTALKFSQAFEPNFIKIWST